MGHDYEEHMDLIDEEMLGLGYEGSFQQAMDMGGPPLITRTPDRCPACGAGLRKVWLQKWQLKCSGNTSFECWKINGISYWPYEASKDMERNVAATKTDSIAEVGIQMTMTTENEQEVLGDAEQPSAIPRSETGNITLSAALAFTAGPWREGQEGNLRVYGPDGQGEHSGLIAVVYKGRGNARLIAAAPALYEACKFVKAFLDKLEEDGDYYDPLTEARRKFHAPLHSSLDNALALAHGQASASPQERIVSSPTR